MAARECEFVERSSAKSGATFAGKGRGVNPLGPNLVSKFSPLAIY
jgi:hypothetical protein